MSASMPSRIGHFGTAVKLIGTTESNRIINPRSVEDVARTTPTLEDQSAPSCYPEQFARGPRIRLPVHVGLSPETLADLGTGKPARIAAEQRN